MKTGNFQVLIGGCCCLKTTNPINKVIEVKGYHLNAELSNGKAFWVRECRSYYNR